MKYLFSCFIITVKALRPSSVNCTWRYYEQQLDHFSPGSAGSYEERVCFYDGYVKNETKYVLFYVGNESPVEEYVNNTGLMWEVGAEIGALLVFAEHRYEGKSVPEIKNMTNCLSFCTVEQALADYASLIQNLQDEFGNGIKVIAIGGSYGGMLAAWMRQKYPSSIHGAIAASAPIWGFPTLDTALDGSSIAVARAFSKAGGLPNDYCRINLLGAWPIISALGQTAQGLEFLKESLNLCSVPSSGSDLIQIIQDVFFDLAEANYPFASTYVTSAVGAGEFPLPAWPVKTACSSLSEDLLINITGNISNVTFSVHPIDDPNISVSVDWNQITNVTITHFNTSTSLIQLLAGVSSIWSTWCNVSGTLTCLDVTGCTTGLASKRLKQKQKYFAPKHEASTTSMCTASSYSGGSWEPLCCNDDLYLANYYAQGIGRDELYWPPNIARNATVASVLGVPYGETLAGCTAGTGLTGYPATSDPWARHMIAEFGDFSVATSALSNVIFSNGLLDPWSAAGVYSNPSPTLPGAYSGPTILNISDTVHAFILDLGAHHLDLFFLDQDNDPDCTFQARDFETAQIKLWLGLSSS
mmetsp:Transcript_1831/g.2791  ORF Transcript_1831/g.2791 Transcript_1831/m.2791 type:complete len:584 (-) Transcript_1831:207-1958(-)